jgi:hypothetical protein
MAEYFLTDYGAVVRKIEGFFKHPPGEVVVQAYKDPRLSTMGSPYLTIPLDELEAIDFKPTKYDSEKDAYVWDTRFEHHKEGYAYRRGTLTPRELRTTCWSGKLIIYDECTSNRKPISPY